MQHYYKIVKVDIEYCRILYKAKNDDGETIFYSLQKGFDNDDVLQSINFYRNNNVRPWYEPRCIVRAKEGHKIIFEKPTGDSRLEKEVREYISLINKKNEVIL